MKYFQTALTFASATAAFFSPVSGECDFKEADIVTELDLFDSEVVTNTLHLPDGELRYNNVGMFKNQRLDLRITVTSGSYTDIAQVWASRGKFPEKQNGKKEGSKFGNINLQTVEKKPKSGEGNFRFCFVEENTNEPVTLEQFAWTIFDLDERGADDGTNGIGIKEKFIMDVSQAEAFQVIEGTEVVISCEDGSDFPCGPGIRTVFHSSTHGTGPDNPTDPNNLNFLQKSRSVAFAFKDTSCWDISYDHYCPVDQPEYTGNESKCRGTYTGGNFLFSGSADQIIDEGECLTASPTFAPTSTPTADPTRSPTQSPSDYPTSFPTKSVAPTNCYMPSSHKVVSSVCMSEKEIIETTPLPPDAFVIDSQLDSNVHFTVNQNWLSEGGVAVKYDNANLESSCDVTGAVTLGTALNFQSQCVDEVTEAIVVVYFDDDFDEDECEACELEELRDMGENFCAYRIEIPCEPMKVDCGEPSAAPSNEPTAVPTATPTGRPTNEPTAVPTATPTGRPTNEPTAVPTATPTGRPTNEPTAVPTATPTGRPTNEPTAVPTASPTAKPTNEPTAVPTASPTDQPTNPKAVPTADVTTAPPTSITTSSPTEATTSLPTAFPTDGPTAISTVSPTLAPPSCPQDVELIKIDGITQVDLGQAVRIVDQAEDKSTVTVRLNQVWTSGTVDHIFYEYYSSPFKSDCTEQTDVPGGASYTPEDITINCMESKPIADLRICVADAGDFLDHTHDVATVPKCCHPDLDPITPVVCYKVLVRCESKCPDAVARRGLRGARESLE